MSTKEEIISQLKALAKDEKIYPSIGDCVIQHTKSNNAKLFMAFKQNRFFRAKDFRSFLQFLNENEEKIAFLLDGVQSANGEEPEIEVEELESESESESTPTEETKGKDTLSEVIAGTINN